MSFMQIMGNEVMTEEELDESAANHEGFGQRFAAILCVLCALCGFSNQKLIRSLTATVKWGQKER